MSSAPAAAAPTSLPPPANAARTWVKALNLLSPTTLFRTKKQLQTANARSSISDGRSNSTKDTTKPPMPVHVLELLAQLVDYLEENHSREEGLYRRESSAIEWGDLKRACLGSTAPGANSAKLPDLATVSPHSVTKVVKEILGQEFEPLIPYSLSQTLLERVALRDEVATLHEIVDKFKLLSVTKRDFLKVFLIHLHHISTSAPCRMTAKQLATHIGVLLIRPVEDRRVLASKDLFKQRERLARLMIENASALPYDYGSELQLVADEELQLDKKPPTTIPSGEVATVESEEPELLPMETADAETAHYVQVMWENDTHGHTEASLTTLLSPFGVIATLAINDSGNRAIVAFSTPEAAEAAVEAELPDVRIRHRKHRSQPSPLSVSSSAAAASLHDLEPASLTTTELSGIPLPLPTPIKVQISNRAMEATDQVVAMMATTAAQAQDNAVLESPHVSPDQSPRFLHRLERPPSILLVQKALKTLRGREEMTLEDVESLPTSPTPVHDLGAITEECDQAAGGEDRSGVGVAASAEPLAPGATEAQADPVVLHRRRSLRDLLTISTGSSKPQPAKTIRENNAVKRPKPSAATRLLSPSSNSSKIGLISDLKLLLSKKQPPHPVQEPGGSERRVPVKAIVEQLNSVAATGLHKTNESAITRSSKRTQTSATILPLQDRATDTIDLHPIEISPPDLPVTSTDASTETTECITHQVDVLTQCLRDVKSELEKLAVALDATRRSDVDRAIVQAHEHLVSRIDHALLQVPSAGSGGDVPSTNRPLRNGSDVGHDATREFVHFLETRSTTQVKILEAEVRAGQELLRLHRSQHQREIAELESESAALRVTCSETEKMCAEMRSELRQCRNELTCHVARAASIQRDRRDVDEKLILCETKLRAKEQELLTLQLAHDEMRGVAATAQIRLDEYRISNKPSTTTSSANENKTSSRQFLISQQQRQQRHSSGVSPLFPTTTAFLDRHRKPPPARKSPMIMKPNSLEPGRFSNSAELAAMQTQLQQRIHTQIETTKASLKEIQKCDSLPLFQDEHDSEDDLDNEEDLEQLEQKLASAQAEMDAAMDESRLKLQQLMEPSRIVSQTGEQPTSRRSNFDPTGLLDELLARTLSTEYGNNNSERASPVQSSKELVGRYSDQVSTVSSTQQSELYKKWLRDRRGEMRTARPTQLSMGNPHHNSTTLRDAQESMQRFQQALASTALPVAKSR